MTAPALLLAKDACLALRSERRRQRARTSPKAITCTPTLADLLGCEGTGRPSPAGAALLARHPETATALEVLLAVG
ncbi:hypothetical protein [Streptomyces sp. LN245]|uniref:hypothetical protein n=1 Tax=Streptomyces sp. LN245 TaxID=3112975 RepID=UPI00371F7C3E